MRRQQIIEAVMVKHASRLTEMLAVRRAAQHIDPRFVTDELGNATRSAYSFLASDKSPTGKALLIWPQGSSAANKNHELTHLYQSELPQFSQTPGEMLSNSANRILNMRAPMELGARMRQLKGRPLLERLQKFIYNAPYWQRGYGGDKSFSPAVWLNRLGLGGDGQV